MVLKPPEREATDENHAARNFWFRLRDPRVAGLLNSVPNKAMIPKINRNIVVLITTLKLKEKTMQAIA